MRELVHEPMNTRSSAISSIGVPGSSAMYWSARSAASRSAAASNSSGEGTRSVTARTMPGLVPQVTCGESAEASIDSSRSCAAPSSPGSCRQRSIACSSSAPAGAPGRGRSANHSKVVSSGAIMPARPPPSIVMLHTVMRPSMLSASIAGPAYSTT